MHIRTKLLVAFAATITAVVACKDATGTTANLHFAGSLTGAKEVPTATTSTATGTAVLATTTVGGLAYSVTWNGLTGTVTGAHIHGPADAASTAGVLIDFSALPTGSSGQSIATGLNGSASGTVNLKGTALFGGITGDSVLVLLNAGKLYINVHTAANPAGEIRTQLAKQ